MSDTVQILASAAQSNVASVTSGQTVKVALQGGTVPLAAQVKGDPVDVSDYALLRIALTSAPAGDQYTGVALHVSLEQAPAAIGPWLPLHTFKPVPAEHSSALHRQRVCLSSDNFVRTSHYWAGKQAEPGPSAWTFGVIAEATPEASE